MQPIQYEKYSAPAQAAFAANPDFGCCILVLDASKEVAADPSASARDKILFAEPFYFLGWRGKTNAAMWIDKLELKSVRNIFLTEKYDIGFDPTPRRPDAAKREAGIARSALNKIERFERIKAKAEAKAAREKEAGEADKMQAD